jgi:hypothetical protein
LNGLVPAIDPERAFITGLKVSYLALSGWAIGEGCLASLSLGPFAPAGCGAVAGADYAFGRWVYDQGAFEGSYLDPEW